MPHGYGRRRPEPLPQCYAVVRDGEPRRQRPLAVANGRSAVVLVRCRHVAAECQAPGTEVPARTDCQLRTWSAGTAAAAPNPASHDRPDLPTKTGVDAPGGSAA